MRVDSRWLGVLNRGDRAARRNVFVHRIGDYWPCALGCDRRGDVPIGYVECSVVVAFLRCAVDVGVLLVQH